MTISVSARSRRTKSIVCAIAVAATWSAMSTSLHAQWLHYPTAGVPRTSDGRPNVTAPAPRTADGKPDLSGLWDIEHNRPCPPDGCDDMRIGQEFLNIGWGLPGGLPYQAWAADVAKKRTADLRKDDPNGFCLPTGIVRMHTTPLFKKIVQTPALLVILNERNAMYRQIFTDSRPLPVDPNPSWVGYSSGKWEGDVLVVQTIGFRDGMWLDAAGSPMTEGARITERFRRVNYGTLEIELTVDDPKAYTKPWSVTLKQFLILDTDLLDYMCVENEKDSQRLVGK